MQSKNRLFRLTWVVVLSFNMIWVFTKVSLLLLFTFSQEVLHLFHKVQRSKGNFRHANTHVISFTHPLPQTHIKHTDADVNTHTSLLFVFIEDLISRSLSVCGLISGLVFDCRWPHMSCDWKCEKENRDGRKVPLLQGGWECCHCSRFFCNDSNNW